MMDTRQHIIEKNYEAMLRQGFQGLRPDKVVATLGITKGAFYHYFPGKLELGYAIVDELIAPRYIGLWKQLDHYQGHPIDGIIWCLEYIRSGLDEGACALGCPLNNLINEMAPLDEGFRNRLMRVTIAMNQAISQALNKALQNGQLSRDINPESYAYFVLAALEGCFSVAKSVQQKSAFDAALSELIYTLRSIKSA